MSDTFIILANGKIENPDLLKERLSPNPVATVIAADGGYQHAESLGLSVDLLVGDLDSVSQDVKNKLVDSGASLEPYSASKDEIDLELALLHAKKLGATDILMIGALGGRVDMSLANLLLLTHPQMVDVQIQVWNDLQTIWLIRPPGGQIAGQIGDTVSLFPIAGDATGITTSNLEYELIDATLTAGEVRGVSNVLATQVGQVKFHSGMLLVVHTPGRA